MLVYNCKCASLETHCLKSSYFATNNLPFPKHPYIFPSLYCYLFCRFSAFGCISTVAIEPSKLCSALEIFQLISHTAKIVSHTAFLISRIVCCNSSNIAPAVLCHCVSQCSNVNLVDLICGQCFVTLVYLTAVCSSKIVFYTAVHCVLCTNAPNAFQGHQLV